MTTHNGQDVSFFLNFYLNDKQYSFGSDTVKTSLNLFSF